MTYTMITSRHGLSPRRLHAPGTTYDWRETVQATGATSVASGGEDSVASHYSSAVEFDTLFPSIANGLLVLAPRPQDGFIPVLARVRFNAVPVVMEDGSEMVVAGESVKERVGEVEPWLARHAGERRGEHMSKSLLIPALHLFSSAKSRTQTGVASRSATSSWPLAFHHFQTRVEFLPALDASQTVSFH